jgi:uncharacterized membrane protein
MEEKKCCQVCKKKYSDDFLVHPSFLRTNLQQSALKFFENFNLNDFICLDELKKLRNHRIEDSISKIENIDSHIKERMISGINKGTILTENIDKGFIEKLTFGDKCSDIMAKFGGSWIFIWLFIGMIGVWVLINHFENVSFDPYPFIFLNLFLSCIAAFQAPIIMMSQNRQSEKDRFRDIADYQVNLKAEMEIQQLHDKLDLFMREDWHKLLEIQKLQLEISQEIVEITQNLQAYLAEKNEDRV